MILFLLTIQLAQGIQYIRVCFNDFTFYWDLHTFPQKLLIIKQSSPMILFDKKPRCSSLLCVQVLTVCSVAAGTPRRGWHLTRLCDTSGSRRLRLRRQRCADRLPPSTRRPTVCTEVANPANKSPAWTTRERSCLPYCETSHNYTRPESTDLMRQSTARVLELDDSLEFS